MNKTLLIVDDEPANIDLLKGLLPPNIKVKAALKGEIAVKLITKSAPDLILLDLIMPGLDGFQTLQKIRELPDGGLINVAIVSGNDSPADIQKGQELGAVAHLKKPIDAKLLASVIAAYL